MINGELIVDNFAGGGGASTGIELATGVSVDIAINHDPEAIKMHKANHPSTKHYCEDVWQVDPIEACGGRPVALAWFSPDCKHFSKAKGGKPKDKFIRGLAWVACRWAGLVRPRVIMLENVEEFKTWCPLNRSHRPIKAKQGATFQKFVKQLQDLGYVVEHRELVAADYGTPTMRKRFFLIARCDGKPIVWPEPTHAPADSEEVKKGILQPYMGAYTQLDFSLPCPSIFDSSEEIKEKYGMRAVRPLAPKTMERIARGLKKFVIDSDEPFIVQIGQTGFRKDRSYSVHDPLTTIVSKNEHCLVKAKVAPFMGVNTTNHPGGDCKEPIHTITTGNQHCLISPTLIQYHSETSDKDVRGQTIEEPIMTVDGSNRYGLVTTFLSKFYKTGIGQDCREPLHMVTTSAGHFGEVRAFLERYDLYESNRSNKRADRTRNNSCEERQKVLESRKQTSNITGHNSDRPKKNGSESKIGIPRDCCLERWETVSNACAQSHVGDICWEDTGRNGYKSQKRNQDGQQLGELGSCYKKSESKACSGNGAESIQQLSDGILNKSKEIERTESILCENREETGNINNGSVQSGEFLASTLIKYYGVATGQDIKQPLDTVTTHDRFGLVTIHGVDYQIVDIGLRMLEPKELYGCQGFPSDYIIDRDYTGKVYPRSEQVRRCGNAVCPPLPAALVRANLIELCKHERMPNMRIDDSQEQLSFVI